MRLETLFHFSFYLTLALAAACLTLPSTFFLGWMPFFLIVILALIGLAWRREGKWVLSESAANQLGVFIALGAGGWLVFQLPRSEDDLIAGGVNWPAGLLPHLGPLLMVLLVVKLFRPKRLPDFWVIQTMGLMMVTLAAVLANEHEFGLLLVAYLSSLVWCLALYYPVREPMLLRAQAPAQQVPLFGAAPAGPPTALPWHYWGLLRALQWSGTVVVVGFALFLTAPRLGQSQWDALQLSTTSKAATKVDFAASIDLNRTGVVELSELPAFAVSARDRHGRRQDPAQIARWRLEVLEIYSRGRWYPLAQSPAYLQKPLGEAVVLPHQSVPEQWADDEWLITFQVAPVIAGGLVLAEPVDIARGVGLDPHLDDKPHPKGAFARIEGCDTLVAATQARRKTHAYHQVAPVPYHAATMPAPAVHVDYAAFLAKQPAPKALAPWTRELLQKLPGLSDADRQLNDEARLPDLAHIAAAKALCRHLAASGEYRYSLELRRTQRDLDVTADFLMNVKEGHCERYAGGLALMLRSLGIRCRVVKGYLAAETDEDGQSIVRLSQAHSWVEALVLGAEPDAWQWLTLDPTPSAATQDGALVSWLRWLTNNMLDGHQFWRQLIMEYTPEQQTNVLADLGRALISKQGLLTLLILGGAVAAVYFGRRFTRGLLLLAKRWWAPASAALAARSALYDELLCLVRRHGAPPLPGQTPREIAAVFAQQLHAQATVCDLADVPLRVVNRYYQVRYGGQTLSPAETGVLKQLLAALRNRLEQIKPA